jgi:hypothetical protein
MATPPGAPAPSADPTPELPIAPPSRADPAQIETYKAFAGLMSAHLRAFWTRNNLFQILHVGMFTALAALLTQAHATLFDCEPADLVPNVFLALWLGLLGLCTVGVASAAAWLMMIWRSSAVIDALFDRLGEIEMHLHGSAGPLLAFTAWRQALQGAAGPRTRRRRVRLAQIWAALAVAFAAVWLAAAWFVVSERAALTAACVPESTPSNDSASAPFREPRAS